MDPYTLLLVGFVVVAGAVFVAVRSAAAAVGVLPASTGEANTRDEAPDTAPETGERMSAARDDTDGGTSRITADDRERMRAYLEKNPVRRGPDDLLPSDADADDGS